MVSIKLTDIANKFPHLDNKAVAFLKQVGVTDLISLLRLKPERLGALLNLSFTVTCNLRQSLFDHFAPGASSGLDLYQAAPVLPTLSTGSAAFDSMLQGGLRGGKICELFGRSRTGKTQLCLSAAALCAMSGGKVAYINTAGDLCLQRLQQVIEARGCRGEKAEEVMGRVMQAEALDAFAVIATIEDIYDLQPNLIVFDNISIPFMPMVTNDNLKGALGTGSRFVQALRKISSLSNPPPAVLVVSNQRGRTDLAPGPALGGVFRGLADTRVLLTKVDNNTFKAEVVRGPAATCNYSLGPLGVT